MDVNAIDNLLGQLRAAAAVASGKKTQSAGGANFGAPANATGADFASALKASLEYVNGQQQDATRLARDFELGKPGVALHDVMISAQKANISFQAAVQVRNKLVSAYHDIMNMQV